MLQVQLNSSDILLDIQLGMPVYDLAETVLGVVIRVYDSANASQPLAGRAPIFRHIERFPHKIADRLKRDGYLVVDSGLLSGDYFILPHQITNVTDKGVFLHFRRSELFQL